ncbi:putative endoglucanase [Aspergillus avenaceus]|uniref:AA9 family lytic polysaccharide monooxygenase n=1 Tax=Aspergillus avenaceus TaxID=36643 RepID=A0A5N6TU83_ASPAV|nr:putative endoglucanase [Aspergillus avenaceus]
MKATLSALSLFASLVPLVSGHYVFSKLIVDGEKSQDFEYIRKNSNGYMPTLASDILNDDFRCNQGSMDSASNTKVYTVAPGTEIGFELAYSAVMKHPGPLQIYMSKAPGDVKSYDGSGEWFKVYQEGVCEDISDGLEDTDWCTWGKNSASFNVPKNTPPGQYLVRVEHIGLHRGMSGNAEFYFTCAQIEVTGSGSGSPGPTVSIPGVYKPEDSNIHFNIYTHPTSYELPGPAVWSDNASVEASQSAVYQHKEMTKSTAPTSFATVAKSTTASVPLTTGGSKGSIKRFAQCGGEGWSGSGSCESGTTCRAWNTYYSQCV